MIIIAGETLPRIWVPTSGILDLQPRRVLVVRLPRVARVALSCSMAHSADDRSQLD
jgi:hypothetical protein